MLVFGSSSLFLLTSYFRYVLILHGVKSTFLLCLLYATHMQNVSTSLEDSCVGHY